MSSVSIAGDSSGSVLLTAPAVSGSTQINIAAQSGTLNVGGPAFSAYINGASQSITNNTWTKITYDTEDFDTANCFSSSRFTPNVAGYYILTVCMETNSFTGYGQAMFYKNGSYYARAGTTNCSSQTAMPAGSVVLYMNGSTDYAEIYFYTSASGVTVSGGSNFANKFTGCFLRGA